MGLLKSIFKVLDKLPTDKALDSFYGTLLYLVCLWLFTIFNTMLTNYIKPYASISVVAFSGLVSLLIIVIVAYVNEVYDRKYLRRTYDIIDALFTVLLPAIITIYLYVYC